MQNKSTPGISLTENQKKIIDSSSYPMYIKAGAGTGKTEVLISKIINILENDPEANLDNMVIITFTNKATDEMKSRLSDRLYKKYLNNIACHETEKAAKLNREMHLVNITNISTIHTFCEKLLREYGLEILISPNFNISSYYSKTSEIIRNTVLNKLQIGTFNEFKENALINMLNELYRYNDNNGISTLHNDYKNHGDTLNLLKFKFINLYNEIVQKIEYSKTTDNVLTPNDLIRRTSELLNNKNVCKLIKEKYKYLLMDEFQDTNLSQFKMAKVLIECGVNVFLVGDERQSIYRFRGADINNSIKMTSYINNINQTNLLLNENFRSDFAIIDKVNSIFTHDFKYKEKTLHFDKTLLLKPDIADKSCENAVYFSSYSNVVDTIHDLIENQKIQGKNINYGDITILCRKNYMVDNIGEILKNAGIPVEVIGGRGFYRAKEIIDIGKFLNYIVYRRLEYKKELFLTDIYKAFLDTGGTDFDKFLNNLTVIAKSESIESVLSYIIDTSKLTQYYDKKGYYQANANISKLRDMASDGPNNSFMPSIQFLDFITRRIISLAEEDEAPISDDNRKNGVVSVYTVHKAKGLSFPIVIIAGMDENLINPKHFPMVITNQNNNQINISFKEEVFKSQIKDIEYEKSIENYITDLLEEELRIFYVACTRAKHMLLFSTCKNNNFNNNCVTWTKWLYESKNHHT